MRTLYSPFEPYESGVLTTPDGHDLYFEQSGNPDGKPVVFLHGGPGGGTLPVHRQFFDPEAYRIILYDQRGAGKSKPQASLENNTTWHLVDDLDLLRKSLGLSLWQIFGGSWGSTLALAYAEKYPERVTELVLRGIFLFRQSEIDWFYGHGTRRIFPEFWEDFVAIIPEEERGDIIKAYYKLLTGPDKKLRSAAAKSWALWEHRTITLVPDDSNLIDIKNEAFVLAFSRIESHYFVNKGFFGSDGQLLEDAHLIQHIPTTIIHGRYDAICPAENAWALKRVLPDAELVIVPACGHSAFEPGIIDALITATDRYR